MTYKIYGGFKIINPKDTLQYYVTNVDDTPTEVKKLSGMFTSVGSAIEGIDEYNKTVADQEKLLSEKYGILTRDNRGNIQSTLP